MTSVVFMLLVALFVIVFFAQAAWEARKHRIERNLDALVFPMMFLSVPATGRLIQALMRAGGVENTCSKEPAPMRGGYQVELVDITILLVAAVPISLWSVYAIPRGVYLRHPAKLWIGSLFLGLPLVAMATQTTKN